MTATTEGGPARAALFVERDAETVRVRRRLKHHCTREEWGRPALRAAAIAACWRLSANLRAEGETLVAPAPVTLYRDPFTGAVVCADIRMPQDAGPRWIDPTGVPLLAPRTAGLVSERTTYEHWAEGPLPYTGDLEAVAPPDPTEDRDLQQVRHQNRWLRAAIDDALEPASDAIPHDLYRPTDLVDFRVRGVFSRLAPRVLESRQDTGGAALNADAKVILDGQTFSVSELIQEG